MAAHGNRPILPFIKGNPAIADRFWAKVKKRGPDDCWDWQASTDENGYGRFKLTGYEKRHANRVAWALANERDPAEFVVRHTCDRPSCVNPAHLLIGTVQDNTNDKMARGRHRSGRQGGENNGAARLTKAQIGEIVPLLRTKLNNCEIAARYPVSDSLISRIRTARSWQREAAEFGWEPAIAYLAHLCPTPSEGEEG